MTELEHIEIEGFKGLEHVELEPTDINLITGRNNTGKTSFLEAVNLLFGPQSIRSFNIDLEKIINNQFDTVDISGEISGRAKTVRIKIPAEDSIYEYLVDALNEILHLGYQTDSDHAKLDTPPEWLDDKRELLQQSAFRAIDENREKISNSGISCIILEIDETEYPYVYFGDREKELLNSAYKEVEDVLESEYGNWQIAKGIGRTIRIEKDSKAVSFDFGGFGPGNNGAFLNEPPETEIVNFLKSKQLSEDISEIDKEENAIKIDDIGDYLKRTNLVDDLKTFNLDYLVFEEEMGEKYDVPYQFMGDGFKAIVGLLWELIDEETENNIVLIEEPENHMHPGYVTELVHFLIDLARDEDIQFFITTHDHDFIKDFFMDMPEEKREYLENEFSLVKMDDFGADVMEYEEAEHHLKDLHLDLRGI